jgi:Asp-tRNA(Asn)/Glu-tRNA(Gln) amidotransferase A subunit family amidase
MTVTGSINSSVSISLTSYEKYANSELDDIDLVEGMPVGIQVVGGRFGEEKCIAVAKAINRSMEKFAS